MEYTPQSYLQSDLNMLFANYSKALVGKSPIIDSIDGGTLQTTNESFANGESDLDLGTP
jgi:tripeptidyl-peptidase I